MRVASGKSRLFYLTRGGSGAEPFKFLKSSKPGMHEMNDISTYKFGVFFFKMVKKCG